MQKDLNTLEMTVENGVSIKWETITKAYKKRARKCHPDKGGSKEAFTQLATAYNELETIFKKPISTAEGLFNDLFGNNAWNSLFGEESWDLIDFIPKDQRDLLNEMWEVLVDLLKTSGKNHEYFFGEYFIQSSTVESVNIVEESSSIDEAVNAITQSKNYKYKLQYKNKKSGCGEGVGRKVFSDHAEFLDVQNKLQHYSATSDVPALKSMVEAAMQHLNQFSKDKDIEKLKIGLNEVFDKTSYKKYKPFSTQIYDALIMVIRAFFRMLDYLVTYVTRADKLMADTYTPGAQSIVNRSHFFTYSAVPATPSKKLLKLKEAFDGRVEKLENLFSSSTITTSNQNGC